MQGLQFQVRLDQGLLLMYQTFLSKDFRHKLGILREHTLHFLTCNSYHYTRLADSDSDMSLLNFRVYSGVCSSLELVMSFCVSNRLLWSGPGRIYYQSGQTVFRSESGQGKNSRSLRGLGAKNSAPLVFIIAVNLSDTLAIFINISSHSRIFWYYIISGRKML